MTVPCLPLPPYPCRKGRGFGSLMGPAPPSKPHPENLVEDGVQIPFLHCCLALALLIREEVAFDVAGAEEVRNEGKGRGPFALPAPCSTCSSHSLERVAGLVLRFIGVKSLNSCVSQGYSHFADEETEVKKSDGFGRRARPPKRPSLAGSGTHGSERRRRAAARPWHWITCTRSSAAPGS